MEIEIKFPSISETITKININISKIKSQNLSNLIDYFNIFNIFSMFNYKMLNTHNSYCQLMKIEGIWRIFAASIKNKIKSVLLKDSNNKSYYFSSFIPNSTVDFSQTTRHLISFILINRNSVYLYSLKR